MKIQIAEVLSWALVDDAEDDSEREIDDQTAADERRGAVGGTRILRVRSRAGRLCPFTALPDLGGCSGQPQA